MTGPAVVVSAIALGAAALVEQAEPQIAVPESHLRRLLEIERAAREALTYRRPSGAISPSQAKRLRTAVEGMS